MQKVRVKIKSRKVKDQARPFEFGLQYANIEKSQPDRIAWEDVEGVVNVIGHNTPLSFEFNPALPKIEFVDIVFNDITLFSTFENKMRTGNKISALKIKQRDFDEILIVKWDSSGCSGDPVVCGFKYTACFALLDRSTQSGIKCLKPLL